MMRVYMYMAGPAIFGAIGCSDPVPPPAQAGVTLQVRHSPSPPEGTSCPGTGVARIGNPAPEGTNAGTRAVDGKGHHNIECSVKRSGDGFNFSADIAGPDPFDGFLVSITINGSVEEGGTGTGSMSLYTSQLGRLSTPGDQLCTFDVSEAPQQVAPGLIWATFDCPAFRDTSAIGSFCKSEGMFILENCD